MATIKISSREFNQDTAKAKRAASQGPVFITTRGKAAYVLLSMTSYMELKDEPEDIVKQLSMSAESADIEFEPPRLSDGIFKAADFS